MPAQGVLLALELRYLASPAGKHQDGLVVSHQLSGRLRGPDDAAIGRDQVTAESARLPEPAIGQRPDPGADGATHEVRNQQHLVAGLSVIAHQQEPTVGGQLLQTAHVGPGQVDDGRNAVVHPLERIAQDLDTARMVHHCVDIDWLVHDILRWAQGCSTCGATRDRVRPYRDIHSTIPNELVRMFRSCWCEPPANSDRLTARVGLEADDQVSQAQVQRGRRRITIPVHGAGQLVAACWTTAADAGSMGRL